MAESIIDLKIEVRFAVLICSYYIRLMTFFFERTIRERTKALLVLCNGTNGLFPREFHTMCYGQRSVFSERSRKLSKVFKKSGPQEWMICPHLGIQKSPKPNSRRKVPWKFNLSIWKSLTIYANEKHIFVIGIYTDTT